LWGCANDIKTQDLQVYEGEMLARACHNYSKNKAVRASDELWKWQRGERKEVSSGDRGGGRAPGGRLSIANLYHDIL